MRSPLPWLMAHTPDPGKWQGWCGTWPGVILTGALSGALASLGLAPHSSWVAALGALLIVLLSLSALSSPWRILALILSFFAVLGSLGLSWLNFVMEGFGAVPPALSRILVFLASLLIGLPYAAWCAIGRRLLGPRNITLLLLVVPPGFLVGDLTCGLPFHHFPWLWLGYSAVEGPFAAFAPWVGALGISYLMVLTAAAAALAARRVYTCLPVAGAILAAGILLHGIAFTTLQGPRLQVGLVQGNIEQRLKWDPAFAGEVVATYWELSRPHLGKLDALVWPEAALPLFLEDAPELISDLNTAAAASSTPILTGLQRHDGDGHAYNIILGLGASADPELAQVYDKRILVPLGEYVPYASFFRQFGNMFNIPMSSFSEGAAGQRPLRLGAVPLIPAICYESVFPTLLAEMDSESAGGILMVSNDAWFGDTRGPLEHLVIARMRSMELQKPQLRATNNGVTALIGPFGGIERRLPQNERGVLEVELQPRQGATPYSRLGNLPLYALALASLLLSLAMARREGRNDALRRLVRP